MRRVANPPNPYVSELCDWLGPPPPVELEVYEERAGSILSENDSPDLPYRWSLNPYRGCQHGCAYCYARCTHEYLGLGAGTDFESRIVVKVNAAERLAAAFARRGWQQEVVMFSGATDCYQPLEAVYGLTRGCLEVCREFSNPVGVVTKSQLVVRDLELLVELRRRAAVRVCFSIPFADEQVARKLEPGAPAPRRQFAAMRRLAAAGVPVGIMLAPVIPGLNDRDIPALLQAAADCGARTACYTPLRLPGSVAQVFLERLQQELPAAAGRVQERVRALRGGELNENRFGLRMRGQGAYWQSVTRLFEMVATRLGLDCGQAWRRAGKSCLRPGGRQLDLFEGRAPR